MDIEERHIGGKYEKKAIRYFRHFSNHGHNVDN